MTDSENSLAQDNSDEDIYKDFAEFNFEDELAKLEGSKENYKQEAHDLNEKVKKLTEENDELKKANETLKRNLSTLLKTAQTEIQRKDSVISELRAKVESVTFRRNHKLTQDQYTTTDDLLVKNEINLAADKRCKSYENRTSSDSDRKTHYDEDNQKKNFGDKKEMLDCDVNRKLGYLKDSFKRNPKHSNSDHDSRRERDRGSRFHRYRERDYENSRSFRRENQDHSKYNFLGKKRHSDDCWPPFKRRNSREKRIGRREVSPERRRTKIPRYNRSRSRGRSSPNRSCSTEKPTRSSLDNDLKNHSVAKGKERESFRLEGTELVKNCRKSEEKSRESERDRKQEVKKEERSTKYLMKNDTKSNNELFETKSPLDALYTETLFNRDSRAVLHLGSNKRSHEIEEEKFDQKDDEFTTEDWTLSFKNERQNVDKPLTLYSKRMLQKLSKEAETSETKEKKAKPVEEQKKVEKYDNRLPVEIEEKEPGELTDDENIVESSKEFQELAKAASLECDTSGGSLKDRDEIVEPVFKEPFKKEIQCKGGSRLKDSAEGRRDESETKQCDAKIGMEVLTQIGDVVEFSPFKNNYKLIEISPIKPSVPKIPLPNNKVQNEVEVSVLNLLSRLVPKEKSESKKKNEKSESEKTTTIPSEMSVNKDLGVKETEKLKDSKPIATNKKQEEEKKLPINDSKIEKKKRGNTEKKEIESRNSSEDNTRKRKREESESWTEVKVKKPKEEKMGTKKQLEEQFEIKNQKEERVEVKKHREEKPGTKKQNEERIEVKKQKDERMETKQQKEEKVEAKKFKEVDAKKQKKEEKLEVKKHREEKLETKKQNEEEAEVKKQEEEKMEAKQQKKEKVEAKKLKDVKVDAKKQKEEKVETIKEKKKIEEKKHVEEKPESCSMSQVKTQISGKGEEEFRNENEDKKVEEDISLFEFFRPTSETKTKADTSSECKMTTTTTMSVTGVVCLETPNKRLEKLKNLMINEQTIYHVMDLKSNGSKCLEMTPRRMLNNDLMLTDSEDDSSVRVERTQNVEEHEEEEADLSEEEEESGSGYDSDSGASDFVDLL